MIEDTIETTRAESVEPNPQELELMRMLTKELGAALEPIEIPQAQDHALRAAARARGRSIRRAKQRDRRRWIAVTGAVACAAAVVLFLAFGGVWGAGADERVASVPVHYELGDLNADGVVDVIDAMVVAKALEDSPTPATRFDVTGDGAVDQSDVDWITTRAVRIDGRPL